MPARARTLMAYKLIETLSKRATKLFHFDGTAGAASIVNASLSVHAIQVGWILPGPNSVRLASRGV